MGTFLGVDETECIRVCVCVLVGMREPHTDWLQASTRSNCALPQTEDTVVHKINEAHILSIAIRAFLTHKLMQISC